MSVVALAGGVGGAKLAAGLYRTLPPDELAVIGNVADDLTLWGLRISPDLDTVLYTLAGLANPATGWGIAGDTWTTLEALGRLGVDTWFRLGDQDIATHIRRTALLAAGHTLTAAMASLATALGVRARLLPMTDQPVATIVDTPAGALAFQDYFVRRHHADDVRGIRFAGIEAATATPEVLAALATASLVVLCPSNPLVSIGPILAVPGLRAALASTPAPVVAVSPIVAGAALRGPADKMLTDLGFEASALGVARLYTDFVDGLVIDTADAALEPQIAALGYQVLVTNTIMQSDADRARLAAEILAWAADLAR